MSREQQVRDAIDRFVTRVRQDTDARLQVLAGELLQIVEREDTSGRVAIELAAIEVARAVARGGVHARHDLISRVITAIRRLDEATTLRGILDALADGAASEAVRVAVLLVDGDTFRSYRHHGYDNEPAPVDIPSVSSPLLMDVVARQQPVIVGNEPAVQAQLPSFFRAVSGRAGLVTPVVVAQQVVAVVYAEGVARQASEPGEPVWTEHVEVLVRHASARLENVTSLRTVEVLTNPT